MSTSLTSSRLPPSTLIICTRNRAQMLTESVESILQGRAVPSELIIMDQSDAPHPTLGNHPIERSCKIRYIWTQIRNMSRRQNLAVSMAQHDIVAFTHDDVFVTPEWFEMLIRTLVNAGPKTIVTGQVRPTAAEVAGGFAPTIKVEPVPATYRGRIVEDILLPFNMAMYCSTFQAVGGFDERLGPGTPFPGADDMDLSFRLLEAGYRIVYVPEAVLYHRAWRGAKDYGRVRWDYGVGLGGFYAKYLSLRDPYMLGPLWRDVEGHLVGAMLRARVDTRRSYGDVLFVCGIFYGAWKWLLTQR